MLEGRRVLVWVGIVWWFGSGEVVFVVGRVVGAVLVSVGLAFAGVVVIGVAVGACVIVEG